MPARHSERRSQSPQTEEEIFCHAWISKVPRFARNDLGTQLDGMNLLFAWFCEFRLQSGDGSLAFFVCCSR